MLVELRIAGVLVAAAIVVFAVVLYARGHAGKTTLALSLLAGLALLGVAAEPGIVFAIRGFLGIENTPLSGLVVVLIVAVAILFFVLLAQSSEIDDTRSRLSRLVTGLAWRSLEVPEGVGTPGVAVVLPALNEGNNLDALLRRIPATVCGRSVVSIVVDDGSTDHTPQVVRRDRAVLISHPVNQGGGAALRLGYRVAWEMGAPIIVTMDADGQHDPTELDRLVEPIAEGRADFVIGSRLKGDHEPASAIRHIGIYVFNAMISILARRRVTDCSSGYRAFRATELRRLKLLEDQFHTSETILAAVQAGLRVEEVPIRIGPRHSGQSKKPGAVRYGWGFLRAIVKTWWR